jgi:AAA ATPase domain
MVGRDREPARVMVLLDDALAGDGRLVLCTGEAGIGKTRLAEEAAALGHGAGRAGGVGPGGRRRQPAAVRPVAASG